MAIDLRVKNLVNNLRKSYQGRQLLQGILSTSEEHPIIYLNFFKDLKEYKILRYLAKNNILFEIERNDREYSEFFLKPEGRNYLSGVSGIWI